MENKFSLPLSSYLIDNISQLQWSCRRGMLELDVLLSNFLQEKYADLSSTYKILFIQLLNCPDPELFSWLMGSTLPPDADFIPIIEAIRLHAQTRSN